jgi:NAD-dependent dihydropyrimidine dehydrogenase PreA subunit
MPRKILDTCIACGSCQAECPVDCITEGDIYVIDADACIDCGVCETNCPVDAIVIE